MISHIDTIISHIDTVISHIISSYPISISRMDQIDMVDNHMDIPYRTPNRDPISYIDIPIGISLMSDLPCRYLIISCHSGCRRS